MTNFQSRGDISAPQLREVSIYTRQLVANWFQIEPHYLANRPLAAYFVILPQHLSPARKKVQHISYPRGTARHTMRCTH